MQNNEGKEKDAENLIVTFKIANVSIIELGTFLCQHHL